MSDSSFLKLTFEFSIIVAADLYRGLEPFSGKDFLLPGKDWISSQQVVV